MRENFEQPIPEEYLRERPAVFSQERPADAFGAVRRFAESYGEMRELPEVKDVKSVSVLTESAAQSVRTTGSEALERVLQDTRWTDEEKAALSRAVIAEEPTFSAIDDLKNPELKKTALGLRLVIERARGRVTAELLEQLDGETLERFGMHPELRDVLANAIPRLSGTNAEFLRFQARAMGREIPEEGERHPARDAIRERRRVGLALENMRAQLAQRGPEKLCGPAGGQFVAYLEALVQAHSSLDAEGNAYSNEEQGARIEEARQNFIEFYGAHPEFPLVIVPSFDHYVSDETGKNLGRDPELRVLWQAPEDRREAEAIEQLRGPFAESLARRLPEYLRPEDMQGVRATRALVAHELSSYGINMEFAASAQDAERFYVLIKNVQEREFTEPMRRKLKALLPQRSHDLIEHPAFAELANALTVFHELTHRVFPEEGKAAERLGDLDDALCETKSDTFARLAFSDILKQRAQELFGDRAQEALNCAIIGDDLEAYLGGDEPYELGATCRLNILAAQGFLQEEKGRVALNQERLGEDCGAYLADYAADIARMYRLSEDAKEGADPKEAKRLGASLVTPNPLPIVRKLKRQFS